MFHPNCRVITRWLSDHVFNWPSLPSVWENTYNDLKLLVCLFVSSHSRIFHLFGSNIEISINCWRYKQQVSIQFNQFTVFRSSVKWQWVRMSVLRHMETVARRQQEKVNKSWFLSSRDIHFYVVSMRPFSINSNDNVAFCDVILWRFLNKREKVCFLMTILRWHL